jgi:hypothetical protein
MAAATKSGDPTTSNFGDLAAVTQKFTSVADSNTWACGLGNVINVFITQNASGATDSDFQWTASGETVTFHVETGTHTLMVTAIGN